MRRLEGKRFSWPVVQSLHDESYLLPADLPQVYPFREVLPDKSVRVLVQSALSRVVRLGEITLVIETFIDQFVRRKFPTVVVSDRLHPLLNNTSGVFLFNPDYSQTCYDIFLTLY